jgi:hypothetical protein
VSFVSATSTTGVCSLGGGIVTCPLGVLANGASATITLTVTPTAAQPITNTAMLMSDASDPNPANNTASDLLVVGQFGPCGVPTFSLNAGDVDGSPVTNVATGDFNNDGQPDVAATEAAFSQGGVVLFDNTGNILSTAHYSVGSNPAGLIARDFNNDGKLDLAVVNTGFAGVANSGTVSILLGNGDGTFAPATTTTVLSQPFLPEAADFNNDEKLDIVVSYGQTTSTNVSALLNNGNGQFPTKVDYPSGQGPANPILGDFDGNGTIDIAVPNTGASRSASSAETATARSAPDDHQPAASD